MEIRSKKQPNDLYSIFPIFPCKVFFTTLQNVVLTCLLPFKKKFNKKWLVAEFDF